MKKVYAYAIVCFIVICFSSCSLLKVTVSTGDPLSDYENNLRMATRGFHQILQSEIIQAADSIVNETNDMKTKINAVRWKLNVTRAATAAALKSVPEFSAVELWVLCENISKQLKVSPDSVLFGNQTPIARHVFQRLDSLYIKQLVETMPKERFTLMSEFVNQYCENTSSYDYSRLSEISSKWVEYLKEKGIPFKRTVGSVSEVIVDAGDRMEKYADQASRGLSFNKEILEYRLEQDSVYLNLSEQLNDMNHDFERMVIMMEGLPEVSQCMIDSLGQQAQQMMTLMNFMVNETFKNFDYQRTEMQRYISKERENVMKEMKSIADDSLQTVLDSLPKFVGKLLGWIILFIVIILGLPFLAGFWLGKLHERQRIRKEEKKSM